MAMELVKTTRMRRSDIVKLQIKAMLVHRSTSVFFTGVAMESINTMRRRRSGIAKLQTKA
eukprot:CAMPEP_0171928760 /NCGR_PEP_ID=MMETSP0993-20121228/27007_1 /TAXON_ID=483369 /ORGANISM="non described non described, Strain CCMP2098" /LENGTH=59 /DNA_ID=CAMNT_0012568115 /DNA_START=245 /DNA_END=420 /DNA_ORIENTATION=-